MLKLLAMRECSMRQLSGCGFGFLLEVVRYC